MNRRGSCATAAAVLLAAGMTLQGTARAGDRQMPDTTGMGAAMSQMGQMQEMMPGAQLKKLEYKKGDAWVKFEVSPAEVKTGTGVGTMAKAMVGLGRPKSHLILDGEHSDLVFTDSKPRFRFTGEKKDALGFQLGIFESGSGGRSCQVDAGKPVHFFKKFVELKVEKAGDGVWDLTPAKPLDPGEYGLANSMAGPVADFAIGSGK